MKDRKNVNNYLLYVCNMYSNWLNYILYHHYNTFLQVFFTEIDCSASSVIVAAAFKLATLPELVFSIDNTLDWVATHPGSPLLPPLLGIVFSRPSTQEQQYSTEAHSAMQTIAQTVIHSQSVTQSVTQSVNQPVA